MFQIETYGNISVGFSVFTDLLQIVVRSESERVCVLLFDVSINQCYTEYDLFSMSQLEVDSNANRSTTRAIHTWGVDRSKPTPILLLITIDGVMRFKTLLVYS